MNILIIGTTDIMGGAAKVSWDIKQALEKQGHTVSMFVADKRSQDPKVKIIPRQKWRKYLGFLLATDDLLKSDWILKTKEFKEADIVHCHNLHGRFFNLSTLQKMSLLKPVIWTLHDEWALTAHCAHSLENTKLCNGLYTCPSINMQPRTLWNNDYYLTWRKSQIYKKSKLHIVAPSLWLKKRLEKTVLDTQDVRLIYNGIDTSVFVRKDKQEARNILNLPHDKKIVLFLADDPKKNPWKGWVHAEKVIKSYAQDSNTLFVIVGYHKPEESQSNILNITHISDKKTLALYYSASDALLFTSIAENFPLVILEAMSCGLPIVAFDVGGVAEAVEHEQNGYITNKENTSELITNLNTLFSLSKEEYGRMGEQSIQKVHTRFTLKHMTDAYLAFYASLVQ